jgi:hypothetical protein
MRSLWIILFAITTGFTASGIVANLYRVCGLNAETRNGQIARGLILIVAGPNLVFEAAMRGLKQKAWTPSFFWLVTAGLAYWSLALGLLIIDVARSF